MKLQRIFFRVLLLLRKSIGWDCEGNLAAKNIMINLGAIAKFNGSLYVQVWNDYIEYS